MPCNSRHTVLDRSYNTCAWSPYTGRSEPSATGCSFHRGCTWVELALCRHTDGRCRASMLPLASRAPGLCWEDPTAGDSWSGTHYFSCGSRWDYSSSRRCPTKGCAGGALASTRLPDMVV